LFSEDCPNDKDDWSISSFVRPTSKSAYTVAKGGGRRNSERTRQEIAVPQPTATEHLDKECELRNAFISSQGRHIPHQIVE